MAGDTTMRCAIKALLATEPWVTQVALLPPGHHLHNLKKTIACLQASAEFEYMDVEEYKELTVKQMEELLTSVDLRG
jgi:hypothetical protein